MTVQQLAACITDALDVSGLLGQEPLSYIKARAICDLIAGVLPTRKARACHTRDTRLNADYHCHGGSGVTETEFEFVASDPLEAFEFLYPGEFVLMIHHEAKKKNFGHELGTHEPSTTS